MNVQRWLVIYATGLEDGHGPAFKAALIDDDGADGKVKMPYGVSPDQIADDCVEITAIILCADPPNLPFVVMNDVQFELGQPNEDIPAAESEG